MPSKTLKKEKILKIKKSSKAHRRFKMGVMIKDTKVDFVSLTAHQFKRPLSELKLSLEMLFGGDFGPMTDQQNYIIKKVLERIKILIHLVDDLLEMTKVDETNHKNGFVLVDVEEVVESIVESASEEIMRKNIEFTFQKSQFKLPKMILDKEKISLAFQNILDNAVKYTPVGGKITISLESNPKQIEFKIQDSGIGIPDLQKGKLFTKFFRGSNAIKMESVGSGLGLFISKNIIESHHGKIWCESKENEGSTFFVNLPIQKLA